MRVIALVLILVACSDPTKVAPAPTVGAVAGTIVVQSNQQPVAGVHVTIQSFTDTSYTARETTDSLGRFFENNVPAGQGQFQMRNLPTGCDSVLVAGFLVNGGLVDSTTIDLPCGP